MSLAEVASSVLESAQCQKHVTSLKGSWIASAAAVRPGKNFAVAKVAHVSSITVQPVYLEVWDMYKNHLQILELRTKTIKSHKEKKKL